MQVGGSCAVVSRHLRHISFRFMFCAGSRCIPKAVICFGTAYNILFRQSQRKCMGRLKPVLFECPQVQSRPQYLKSL